jgi:nucleotide-binding universal stress UspA family protein
VLRPAISALSCTGNHEITVLRLMGSDVGERELEIAQDDPEALQFCRSLPAPAIYRVVAPQSRVHHILETSLKHDVVIMATGTQRGLGRLFFGSLAEDVAARAGRSMLVVCGGPGPAAEER